MTTVLMQKTGETDILVDSTNVTAHEALGWTRAKKFGIPHIVSNAKLLQEAIFDGSDDIGTLAVDADEIEKNLFSLAGTPNGAKVMDLYYLA